MKALIFDFDGTLADSFRLGVDIFHELIKRDQTLTEAEIQAMRGQSAKEIVKKLGIRWYRLPYLATKARRIMHARLGEVQPFLGIGPILHELHTQGHRLFVVSSNETQTIERFLTEHDIRPFFQKIYGNIGLFGKAKTLRKIMSEQGLGKDECLYIGDEVRDIHAAQKVGMPVVAVTWGYNSEHALVAAKPQFLARQPKELLEACNQ